MRYRLGAQVLTLGFVLAAGFVSESSVYAQENTLTPREKAEGWQLLFDGKTTMGWMTPKKKPLPASHVQNGSLNPHPCDYMLVHETPWDNFVLACDFKISKKCNSGIFVRTSPLTPRPGKDVGFNGIEIAIDDTKGAGFHDTGAIYDLVKPIKNAMKPVGEWNHMVITCDHNKITVERSTARSSRQWISTSGPSRTSVPTAHPTSSTSPTRTTRARDTSGCKIMGRIVGIAISRF